jgi:hypothetical protein
MGRFETEVLTQGKNLDALKDLSGRWIDRARQVKPRREIILDTDNSGCTCYHPLFCFQQFADLERCPLGKKGT